MHITTYCLRITSKNFIRLVLTIVLLTCFLQNTSCAQEGASEVRKGQPTLMSTKTVERDNDSKNEPNRFGLFGGYDILRHIVEFRTIGNFPSCCPGYNQKTDGNGFATGLFYQLSFGDLLSFEDNLQLRVAYRTIGADFSQEEYLGRVRNSNDSGLVDAYSLHTFKSKSSFLSFEPRFSIKPMKLPLHISVGVELGYAIGDMKFSQNEQLIRPAGLVFKGTDSSTSRNTFTDSIIDKSQRNAFIIPGITLGLGIDIPLSSAIKLSPEVTYYLPLTLQQSSLLKPINLISTTVNTPWRFGNLRLGASLSIALSSNKEVDVYDIYQRKDTTTKNVDIEEKESIVLDYTKIDTVAAADKNHFLVTVVEHYTHKKPTSSTQISDNSWLRKKQVETKIEFSDKYEYEETVPNGIRYDTVYTIKTITATDLYINYKPIKGFKKPDSIYHIDNIEYRVFITPDTISKEEKGRIKDTLYITDTKSKEEKLKDKNIVIINTYKTYTRLTPCKAQNCPAYFTWDIKDCKCTEQVSPNRIVLDFKDANGKAVPDTIFTTTSRNIRIRYIYPAVFFNNSSEDPLKSYEKIPRKDQIFSPKGDYFENQLSPLYVVAYRAQKRQDTVVLIGYDNVKMGDSKQGKDLGLERASVLKSFLTKSRPDGPGISTNYVSPNSLTSIQKERLKLKKKFKLPGGVVPDFFEVDSKGIGKPLQSRVEIYGPDSLLKADEGDPEEALEQQEKILSPYSVAVRAIPGNNNQSLTREPITIQLTNVVVPKSSTSIAKKESFNFIDSSTPLRTMVLRGNQPIKGKPISIYVYYNDTTGKDGKGELVKSIPKQSLTPSQRQARGFVDTMTTEISFMLPFFCDNATPNDATEPPTQYEKRVLNETKARILPKSLVEIQYCNDITPESKVKRLAELLGAPNAKLTKRLRKDSKEIDTYDADAIIWEGRFKLTIKTPD